MSGTEMVCPVCSARQDAGLLCASCTDALEKNLDDVRSLVADLDVTLSKQARIGTPGKGGLAREKSPVHFGALDAADTLGNVLTTWARDVDGTWSPFYRASVARAAAFSLLANIAAIRRHPAVAELVDEITNAVEQARRVIDRPADRVYLGQCLGEFPPSEYGPIVTCYAEIWARVDAHETTCRDCGITHEVAERRRWLLERSHDVIATVKQASEYVGEFAGMAVNQKTIRTWMDRGKLPVHVGPTEERHLRLGDLLTILTEKATRSAA